jgi:hypothetical protein
VPPLVCHERHVGSTEVHEIRPHTKADTIREESGADSLSKGSEQHCDGETYPIVVPGGECQPNNLPINQLKRLLSVELACELHPKDIFRGEQPLNDGHEGSLAS